MGSAFTQTKYIIALSLLFSSYSSAPSPLVTGAMKKTAKSENTTIQKAVMQKEIQSAAAHRSQRQSMPSSDIMIVDPKEVAKDWESAFLMLKAKQKMNLVFKLSTGEEISHIEDIHSMPGGFLMLFTLKNLHGLQYKIIKTSEILSLSAQ